MTGNQCEYSNCENQPPICTSDSISLLCSDALIANYCPLRCKQTICQCGFDTCLNGGTFLPSTCSCKCEAQYGGTRCDTLLATTKAKVGCQAIPCQNGGKKNETNCQCEC